jgi:hypothetical protein
VPEREPVKGAKGEERPALERIIKWKEKPVAGAGGSEARGGFKEKVDRETRVAETDLKIGILGAMVTQRRAKIISEVASSSEERRSD